MKRNGHKTRDLTGVEKYFRIEYKSTLDGYYYWHKAIGRNQLDAKECFEKEIDSGYVEEVSEPIELKPKENE
jgi:hypothetical protein